MSQQTRLPTANGTYDNWSAGTGGNKWDEVDDPVGSPDDDTTYMYRIDTDGYHTFTFSAFSVPAGSTINFVRVFARAKAQAGTMGIELVCRAGYTNDYQGYFSPSGTYTDGYYDWVTNPETTSAWTVDEVNHAAASGNLNEVGVNAQSMGTGDEVRATQVYVLVDYTESGPGSLTATPSDDMGTDLTLL